jgi:hypothetical protein
MGLFKDCGCGCKGQRQQEKFVTSVISGLTFFIVANPQTYLLVRRVLGSRIASPNGNPTLIGLLVHSLVFMLVVWAMMNLKKRERYESKAPAPAPAPAVEIPTVESPVVESESPAVESPAPAPEEEVAAPLELGFMGLEESDLDLGSFDFQLAEIGPSPTAANEMMCKCPDGSNVSVVKA